MRFQVWTAPDGGVESLASRPLQYTHFDPEHCEVGEDGTAISRRAGGGYRTAFCGGEAQTMHCSPGGGNESQRHFARVMHQAGDNAMVGVVSASFDCASGAAATDTAFGWGYFVEDGEGKHNGKWVAGAQLP